jgi:hypothetical protein
MLAPDPAAAAEVLVMVEVLGPVTAVVTTAPLLPRFCLRPFSGFSVDCVLHKNIIKQKFFG